MRRIAKLLKAILTATDPDRLPATSFEMTLHDALRICAGRMQNDGDGRPARIFLHEDSNTVQIQREITPIALKTKRIAALFERRI